MQLFGRQKQETPLADLTLPPDSHAVFTFQREGLPGILVVDGALKRIAGHSELPVRLGIALEFSDRSSPQGLPTAKEDETLSRLTADLELLLAGPPRRGFLALHSTAGWLREWMSYVTDLQTARSIAENIRFRYTRCKVTHHAELDRRWDGFRKFSR